MKLKHILRNWVNRFGKDAIEEKRKSIRRHKEELDKMIENTVKEGSVSDQFPIELDDMVICLNPYPMYLPEYIHLIFKSKKYPFTSECFTKKRVGKPTPFSIYELKPYINSNRIYFDKKGNSIVKNTQINTIT